MRNDFKGFDHFSVKRVGSYIPLEWGQEGVCVRVESKCVCVLKWGTSCVLSTEEPLFFHTTSNSGESSFNMHPFLLS